MLSRTYISIKEKEAPGFKSSNDCVTVLVGGNANGDKKHKPLIVYRSENLWTLKNVCKSSLPIVWKSRWKAWITKEIFGNWFIDYFVPEVKKYWERKVTI